MVIRLMSMFNELVYLSQQALQAAMGKLQGIENYTLWNRSIKLPLLGRNKLGLVDGTCRKEMFGKELWGQWKRVNAIVLLWLMNSVSKNLLSGIAFASSNSSVWTDLQERFDRIDGSRTYSLHKEIAILQQEASSVFIYYTKLKILWDEFEVLVPSPGCSCENSRGYVAHMNRQKLYQFLMGLNDSYHQARSQILMIDPLPTINQAYAIIVGNESQKAVVTGINNLGLYSSILDSVAIGHTKESCYKVVGYPPDFKSKRKIQTKRPAEESTSNNIVSQAEKDIKQLLQGCTNTKDQYEQILKMMSQQSGPRVTAPDCNKANNAGKALFITGNSDVWIVDTGATNHMVSKLEMLLKEYVIKIDTSKDMCLLNGGVTKELYTGKIKEVGREEGGLYLLWRQLTQDNASNTTTDSAYTVNAAQSTSKEADMELWHQKIRHHVQITGIIHQRSCPYTPQQNDVAGRKHRHLLEVTRALRFQAKIPIRFWGYCVLAATYLINRLPSSVLEFHTPYERLYDRKPVLSHLRIIGCLALAKNLTKHDKLMPRSKIVVHIGYSEVHKEYILFDLDNSLFFVSRDVTFREDIFPFVSKGDSFAQQQLFVQNLQGLSEIDQQLHQLAPLIHPGNVPSETTARNAGVDTGPSEQLCVQQPEPHTDASGSEAPHISTPTITRRSTRSKQPPIWLKNFISLNVQHPMSNYVSYFYLSPSHHCFITATSSVIEPTSYEEAVQNPRRVEAIHAEIQALESNNTWEITSLPT
ncbi:uncharacterized protein LOC129900095 [Solanum dulcamara]|uniref:uncharacterized protein LOC129900095 n=1 Tax=Solanum dulcamara TaxID=45834 RepID=UPI0024861E3A|nr:uncharacterized protein LOC129900095 [Solanum dulcamara]